MELTRKRSAVLLGVGFLGAGAVLTAHGAPGAKSAPAVTYFIAEGEPESGFRDTDRTLAEWALTAWARQAEPPIVLEQANETDASIRIYWVRAGEGLYGETRMQLRDGRPVADVFVRPDVRGLGPDIEEAAANDPLFRETVVYLTCVHEIGHAFGLPHTAAYEDIMYSFQFGGDFVAYFARFRDELERWDDIRTTSPFSRADRNALRWAVR